MQFIPLFHYLILAVLPPENFMVTAVSSTSIMASWQLPPTNYKNETISGFKLFYKKKISTGSANIELINRTTFTKTVTGLREYTEYVFQVWAFTSAGSVTGILGTNEIRFSYWENPDFSSPGRPVSFTE